MVQLKIPVDKDKRQSTLKYLDVLNVFCPKEAKMHEAEMKVLVEILLLEERFKYNRFSTLARKKIRERLLQRYDWEVSTANLNSKIYSLRDKGFIREDKDKVFYVKDWLLKGMDLAHEKGIQIMFEENKDGKKEV